MKQIINKVPAIICDIDGVVLRGKGMIGNSSSIIQKLKSFAATKIPFYFLTNGGGILEKEKASVMNDLLSLEGSSKIEPEEIILNFTPLREITQQFKRDFVVVLGSGKVKDIALDLNLHCFTQNDLMPYFSERFCNSQFDGPLNDKAVQLLRKYRRLPNAKAIFLLYDPVNWEISMQVI